MTGLGDLPILGAARQRRALRFALEQLAHLLESTGRLVDSLDLVASQGEHEAVAETLRDVHRLVVAGMPFASALALHPRTFSAEQLKLVEAGEQSGDLPDALRRIAQRMERVEILRREWWNGLAYPALLVHGVVLIYPIRHVAERDWSGYVTRVVFGLAILWGGILLLTRGFAALDRRGALTHLPVIGGIRGAYHSGNACWTIGALYESGVPMLTAVESALPERPGAEPPELSRARHDLREGGPFSDFVDRCGVFAPETQRVVRIAETAGDLGRALLGEGVRLEELGTHRLRRAIRVGGKMIYIGGVVLVAIVVLRFWASYYGALVGY